MQINSLFSPFLFTGLLLFPSCKPDKKMMVATGEASNVLITTADVSGEIIDIGEGITQHGHCYSKTVDPTISGTKTELGTKAAAGIFTSNLTGLDPKTKYY